jgi:hypothetical protein
MGADAVFAILQMVDGEKDPRCLMLVFGLMPVRSPIWAASFGCVCAKALFYVCAKALFYVCVLLDLS